MLEERVGCFRSAGYSSLAWGFSFLEVRVIDSPDGETPPTGRLPQRGDSPNGETPPTGKQSQRRGDRVDKLRQNLDFCSMNFVKIWIVAR